MNIDMSKIKEKAQNALTVLKRKAGEAGTAAIEWLSDEDNMTKVYIAELAFAAGAAIQARKIYRNSLVVQTNEFGQPNGRYIGKKGPAIAKDLDRAYTEGWSFLGGADPEKLKK